MVTAAEQKFDLSIVYSDRQNDVLNRIYYKTPPGWKALIGFGGALGGGKTWGLVALMWYLGVIQWPGSRILIGRNELGPLEKTALRYFLNLVDLPKENMQHDQTARIIKLRLTGWPAKLWTEIHYHPLSDQEKVQGEEYNVILVDEANGISLETMGYLNGRLRHRLPHPELARQPERFVLVCASNPHPGWYTDWFWKGELLKNEDGVTIPGEPRVMTDNDRMWIFREQLTTLHFVRSMMTDNPHLPAGYAQQATIGMDPGLAKRFIEGRFDVFDGAVFTEFRPWSVAVPSGRVAGHIWDADLPMPEYVQVIGGIDLGGETAASTTHFTAGVVAIQTKSGRRMVVDEFKKRGPGVDMKLAEWIVQMEQKWGRPIGQGIRWRASKDQRWGLKGLGRGAQIIIQPNKGTFDAREENVSQIQRMFMHDLMFIHSRCVGLIEELRNYVYDKKAIERGAGVKFLRKKDDLVDAFQYLIENEADGPRGDPSQIFSGMYRPMR